ncbi:MAG: VCBS repeat-containing protein [Bacteroidota bacterium]
MKKAIPVFLLSIALLFAACSKKKEPKRFVLKKDSGILFSNHLANTQELNILNYLYFYNGAGVASGDFNGDGLLDIYFTSNLYNDQLYLNKGGLTFSEITLEANIDNQGGWTTGVTTVDINSDGLLDIYVSKASGHLDLKGNNLLYVNQGNKNGIPTFTEAAAAYNLNRKGLYTQAAFFDYDRDGDLDVYLLKHSVHPNANYGNGAQRTKIDTVTGDQLLRNDNGYFVDVSSQLNILQNPISFGLGIATSDLNNDGGTDLYIGNDFFEHDYLYMLQSDTTYLEANQQKNALGHTTHFSMGNDMADINNDGYTDIISVDMLPENLVTLKASGQEYSYPVYQNQLKQGYQPQFMQNTLHLNRGGSAFSEIAFLSGMAATEWSWSPLVADFNNDGHKDLYITNGILGATNDLDFVNFISNESIQKRLGSGMTEEDLELISKLPKFKVPNYFFENKGSLQFSNRTSHWFDSLDSYSNGAIYGDLDNDGDLDLIVNNNNDRAFVLENKTQQLDSLHYLKVKFQGSEKNRFGIGAKLQLYNEGSLQHFENYTTRGYLSAKAPEILVGLGKSSNIDSLMVIWPNGNFQTLKNLAVDTILTVIEEEARGDYYSAKTTPKPLLSKAVPLIDFKHRDGTSIEFTRDPLIPYATTNQGPVIKAGDLNNDGREDLIALGAKGQATELWEQLEDGSFQKKVIPHLDDSKINEDIDVVIFDANGDALNDLLIVSGGNEFRQGEALKPRLYLQEAGNLVYKESQFPISVNASKVTAVDLNDNGNMDISISANVVPREFGITPKQYIFMNDGHGNFTNASDSFGQSLQNMGNIEDIVWEDIDSNGFPDAIVAGHWMPISILLNTGKELKAHDANLNSSQGWWNTLEVADYDQDGDMDIVAGNWGLNTRLSATPDQPLQLYLSDFDENGKVDPILTYYYNGIETTLATKDELVKQLPFLNKKYLSYQEFASANLEELFGKEPIRASDKKKVNSLSTTYFENNGNNTYTARSLPPITQFSKVEDIWTEDFNKDGFLDILLVGNFYETSTQIGRLDGSQGTLLLNDTQGYFRVPKQPSLNINGACRSIEKIMTNQNTYYIVGRNNDSPLFLIKED